MDYGKLINNNLRKAFNLLRGVAVDVTLTKNKGVTFNFNAADTSTGSIESITTKAVVVSQSKLTANNTVTETIMLQKQSIGAITGYDKVTHRGLIWSIGPIISDDEYIITLALVREIGHG